METAALLMIYTVTAMFVSGMSKKKDEPAAPVISDPRNNLSVDSVESMDPSLHSDSEAEDNLLQAHQPVMNWIGPRVGTAIR